MWGGDKFEYLSFKHGFGLHINQRGIWTHSGKYRFPSKSLDLWSANYEPAIITMELDMKVENNCFVNCHMSGQEKSKHISDHIDVNRSCKLAISLSEAKPVEGLHDHLGTNYELGPIYLHGWIDFMFNY